MQSTHTKQRQMFEIGKQRGHEPVHTLPEMQQ